MTVEELRMIAINVMRNIDVPSYPELVDSLIAAAREEGAEQERERIVGLVKGEYHVGPPFYLKLKNPLEPDPEWYALLPKNVFWQNGNSGGCGTPASVLAPTEPEVKP